MNECISPFHGPVQVHNYIQAITLVAPDGLVRLLRAGLAGLGYRAGLGVHQVFCEDPLHNDSLSIVFPCLSFVRSQRKLEVLRGIVGRRGRAYVSDTCRVCEALHTERFIFGLVTCVDM